MVIRLERGCLAASAEGQHHRDSAADFERCLQLGGTDLRDDELFSTVVALTGYYASRADIHRLARVLESLLVGVEQGRQWFRPATDVMSGVLAWLRGEFAAAACHFEQASADLAAGDHDQIDAVWFVPSIRVTTAHLHLAGTSLVQGASAWPRRSC